MGQAGIVRVVGVGAGVLVVAEAVDADARVHAAVAGAGALGVLAVVAVVTTSLGGGGLVALLGQGAKELRLRGLEQVDQLAQALVGAEGVGEDLLGLLADGLALGLTAVLEVLLDDTLLVGEAVRGNDGLLDDGVAGHNALHVTQALLCVLDRVAELVTLLSDTGVGSLGHLGGVVQRLQLGLELGNGVVHGVGGLVGLVVGLVLVTSVGGGAERGALSLVVASGTTRGVGPLTGGLLLLLLLLLLLVAEDTGQIHGWFLGWLIPSDSIKYRNCN
eukprot:255460_1